jgi:hypothetical protein
VNRIRIHLTSAFEDRELASFRRDELQDLLDRKAGSLSFSVVDHLRWDLKQILDMAVAEGQVVRNPALLLFTPKEAAKPERRVMNIREVRLCFSVLDERERLIKKLAILAGMRPGEIFAPVGPVGGDPRRYSPTGLSWRDRHAENGSIIAEGGSVRRSACGHPKVAGEDGDD